MCTETLSSQVRGSLILYENEKEKEKVIPTALNKTLKGNQIRTPNTGKLTLKNKVIYQEII